MTDVLDEIIPTLVMSEGTSALVARIGKSNLKAAAEGERSVMVEGEQPFFCKRRDELDGEEWVAGGLIMHQLPQRGSTCQIAVKRICHQLPEML